MKRANPTKAITAYIFELPKGFFFERPKKEFKLIKWKIAPNIKIDKMEFVGTVNITITA